MKKRVNTKSNICNTPNGLSRRSLFRANECRRIWSADAFPVLRYATWICISRKKVISPPFLADVLYAAATEQGMLQLLPQNISPSDTPHLGKFLESIDPLNHSTTITDDTVFFMISIEHGGDGHGWHQEDTKFERIKLDAD
ncbi:MAG: hypothetical protein VB034_00625 [Eubacteriales bacterium]|nr:hypothetical protein [Eubacteriales bacterium]